MNNLIDIEYLKKHLHDEEVVIVDCRFNLADPEQGREDYRADHISGAFFLDLATDLSGEVLSHGGRHPLPKVESFIETIEAIGIDNTKHVIAYDDQNGPFAARLWWLLKYLGHNKVSVLNANYSLWKESGYSISKDIPLKNKVEFNANIQTDMIIELDQVKEIAGKDSYKLIDSRAPRRYRGEVEPIDLKAGRIPGAENYFWEDIMTNNGLMKSNEALEKHFSSLEDDENIVVYCGSGVTGSVNILALDNLGKKAKLYPGGWSDWSSYEDNKVEIGG